MSDSRLKTHARESGLARLREIAWYRARGTIVFLYHLLVLLCLFSAGPCPCVGGKNQNKKTRRNGNAAARQSLCAEMASELRFAMRCGSRQRPAAKARNSDAAVPCDRCSPRATRRRTRYCSTGHEETTYIPSIEIPRLNGVSPVPHDGLATMASLLILLPLYLSLFPPLILLLQTPWRSFRSNVHFEHSIIFKSTEVSFHIF